MGVLEERDGHMETIKCVPAIALRHGMGSLRSFRKICLPLLIQWRGMVEIKLNSKVDFMLSRILCYLLGERHEDGVWLTASAEKIEVLYDDCRRIFLQCQRLYEGIAIIT